MNLSFSHLTASFPLRFGSACQALAPREGAVGSSGGRIRVAMVLQLSISYVFRHQVFPLCNTWNPPTMWAPSPGMGAALLHAGSWTHAAPLCMQVHAGGGFIAPARAPGLSVSSGAAGTSYGGRHIRIPTVPVTGGLYRGVVNANQHLRPSVILGTNCTWAVPLLLPGEPVPGMLQGCCSRALFCCSVSPYGALWPCGQGMGEHP